MSQTAAGGEQTARERFRRARLIGDPVIHPEGASSPPDYLRVLRIEPKEPAARPSKSLLGRIALPAWLPGLRGGPEDPRPAPVRPFPRRRAGLRPLDVGLRCAVVVLMLALSAMAYSRATVEWELARTREHAAATSVQLARVIDAQKSEVAQSLAKLGERNTTIAEQDTLLHQRDSLLNQRELLLQTKLVELKEMSSELQLREQRIQHQDLTIGSKDKALQERDGQIAGLNQKVDELTGALASLEELAGKVRSILGIRKPTQPAGGGTALPGAESKGSQKAPATEGSGATALSRDDETGRTLSNPDARWEESQDSMAATVQARLDSLGEAVNAAQGDLESLQKAAVFWKQEQDRIARMSKLPASQREALGAPRYLPVRGPITSTFGPRTKVFGGEGVEMHYGVDIAVPVGTPVLATKDGVVIVVAFDNSLGNYVRVAHENGFVTMYAHNSKIAVTKGQQVKLGDVLAYSGNTGASTGPHVHYALYRNGTPIDPLS